LYETTRASGSGVRALSSMVTPPTTVPKDAAAAAAAAKRLRWAKERMVATAKRILVFPQRARAEARQGEKSGPYRTCHKIPR